MITRDQVVDRLKKLQGKRSNVEFAKYLGITSAYLGDIYFGRRDPGPAVLEKLKLRRVVNVMYEAA